MITYNLNYIDVITNTEHEIEKNIEQPNWLIWREGLINAIGFKTSNEHNKLNVYERDGTLRGYYYGKRTKVEGSQ
mgnify:FL=1|jgi:hypothetical protein|tara:strand:+ start:477 stop:701 length:225 start_codon:yes stop_codon:yes gene_type:complete